MDKTETAQPDSTRQNTATNSLDGAPDAAPTSGGSERSSGAADVLQRYLKAQSAQISRIAANLTQHRQDVQKLEVALIARIADVDDDRRHAATRLQRTLQTQRDELDERLKRQGSLMAMLLLVFSLLVAGTLVFFLLKLNATQEAFETQINTLQRTLEHVEPAAPIEPDPQTRVQLERLSAALAGISQSIERLNEEAATTTPLDLNLNLEPEPTVQPAPGLEPEPELVPESEPAPEPEPELETSPALDPTPAPEPEPEPEPVGPEQTPVTTPPESLPVERETPLGESEPSAVNSQEAEESEETAVPAADSGPLNSRSLMANSVPVGDRSFTVQLIGFHTLDTLDEFATNSALPMVYYYREETYQGRPWFVLIHSLHQTREAAEAVVAKLPPELANLNIWIRQLKPETELIEVRRLGS